MKLTVHECSDRNTVIFAVSSENNLEYDQICLKLTFSYLYFCILYISVYCICLLYIIYIPKVFYRVCFILVLLFSQTLQKEIEGHQPRVDEVLERGRRMEAAARGEGRPEADRIQEQLKELETSWDRLQDEMNKRRDRLNGSNCAQQYYNDADEAEAWIGEQELYMIADEKAKVSLYVYMIEHLSLNTYFYLNGKGWLYFTLLSPLNTSHAFVLHG